MVKPEILWAYAKTSQDGDELFLGKLLRHLAGHTVEFSSTERLAANALMQSNEWHTENIESKKERDALYQRINRLEKLLKENGIEIPKKSKGDSQCQIDKSLSISLTHSLSHSLSHSPEKEVCEKSRGRVCARAHTHARAFDDLSEAEAIAAGESAGVSAEVARQVFADMKANGGGYMTRGGVFVKVTGENLQAAIRTMSQHAKPIQQAAAMPKPKKHTAAEIKNAVALCAERCARLCGGKCGAGVAVLPALSERPHPPQECKHFKALKER